jgi:iron complex transport system substrate-binding protein
MRICSLLPSATEIVAELGLVESLVGISEECDWPPEVLGLPVVTASRVDTTRLTSLEIDEAVREAVGDGRDLYTIDHDFLEALQPDLILTQNLCAVCAVSADNMNELCATDAEVVALDAHTLDEIEERILLLADLLGVPARGRTVVAEMEAKIAAVRARVADAPTRSVFVAEWLEPPYAAGHWIPEMVKIAGGRDVLGQAGAPSYPTSWEAVRNERPELVVVAPCGFDHERAAREATLPPLACRAVAVDSNAYYARPAPRLADGIAQLAFLIHPDLVGDPGLPYVELADPGPHAPAILDDVAADHRKAATVRPAGSPSLRERSLTVAFLHLAPELGALDRNRTLIEYGTRVAADSGADWVLSGELVVPGYRFEPLIGTNWIAGQPDSWMRRLARLSSDLGVTSFVSHPERDAVTGKLFNSFFVIGRNGQILGRQRKLDPTPDSEDWASAGAPGHPIPVDGMKIGLLVCADAYKPLPALRLRDSGAELLVSAAAWWPGEWGPKGEWEARTLDTDLPMIVCNRTGCDHESQLFGSESVVVDRGEKLLTLRARESTAFIVDCRLGQGHIANCELLTSTVLRPG